MKKRFSILFLIVAVVLSAAAGFWGAFFAYNLMNASPDAREQPQSQGTDSSLSWDAQQMEAYLEAYLASRETDAVSPTQNYPADAGGASDSAAEGSNSEALLIPGVAALASASVVEVYTESVAGGGRMWQYITEGAGSGVVISPDGYIVTNNHVIEGSRRITVRMSNGAEYDAALVGRDSNTDLAVLKIEAAGLRFASFGDSDTLMVGELAVAIGNPLGELGGSVSEGIISALSRKISIDGYMMDLLQITAAVNPGNSGGGLFNRYGELIGVVNAKSGGSDIEGIGFAIPVNIVKSITDALIEYGYVPGRIDFGATLIDILDARTALMYRVSSTGVYVSQADADSPLVPGDRIISMDGKDITLTDDVEAILEDHTAGDVLSIVVARGGYAVTIDLTLKQAVQ